MPTAQERVQQLTGRIGRTIGTAYVEQVIYLLDKFHRYPVEQNGSDCLQAMCVVQQLT